MGLPSPFLLWLRANSNSTRIQSTVKQKTGDMSEATQLQTREERSADALPAVKDCTSDAPLAAVLFPALWLPAKIGQGSSTSDICPKLLSLPFLGCISPSAPSVPAWETALVMGQASGCRGKGQTSVESPQPHDQRSSHLGLPGHAAAAGLT